MRDIGADAASACTAALAENTGTYGPYVPRATGMPGRAARDARDARDAVRRGTSCKLCLHALARSQEIWVRDEQFTISAPPIQYLDAELSTAPFA